MFNVVIHDLDPEKVRHVVYCLETADAETIEKEKVDEGNYDISFYCKVVCYMKSPLSYLLTVNNETVLLNRYDFSFISIS